MNVRNFIFIAAILALCASSAFAADVDSSYKPGPDDVLLISVWKEEALTREVVVTPDGNVTFPLIGEVMVKGHTLEEVRKEVQTKIEEFSPGAPVSIMVIKVNSPKVYVTGKVLRPGAFLMSENLTVMQAIALAGGFTPFAERGDILILREARGKTQSMPFDYDAVAKGKHLEQNIILNRGDNIVVP